jgi:hypothetical protein
MAAPAPALMTCPLCGYRYDPAALNCHAACPLAAGCRVLCCPHCGYQTVDERRSLIAQLLERLRPPQAERGREGDERVTRW